MSLELLDVTHRYGRHLALSGVSLCVRAGDCYGFLGHNGAGKTTAMRIALGLTRPTSGTVRVNGLDAAAQPLSARARMSGLIETPGFHGHLSGERNLLLLARLQGMGRTAARGETARVLDLVGLGSAARKPAGAYSQGMRQRLGIAQALLGRPAYVLLDEPTNGLDPEGIEEIRRVLRTLTRDEGTSVLVSSHQLHELAGVCNRVAILRQGVLLVEEETARLLGAGRHEVRVGDADVAARVFAAQGIHAATLADGTIVLPGVPDGARLLGDLVAAGARPTSFGERTETLEDVYLRVSRGAAGAPARVTERQADVAPAAPPVRVGRPIGRMTGYELRRWTASAGVPLLLVAPALAAAAGVAWRAAQAAGFAAEVKAGNLATTTDVTAFEGLAWGLRAGLPVLALVAAGIASQSIAGELARGTLRNVLLRPLTRTHAVLGKALAAFVATALGYALLVGVSVAAAAWAFDFGDVTEVLFNGERFPLVAAADLWPPLREALWRPLPAALSFAALGIVSGAVTRGAASALALALGLVVVPDVLRAVLGGFDAAWTVPSAHVPTMLSDTSFVAHFRDLSQGVSNTTFDLAASSWGVPAVWTTLALIVSVVVLSRRSVR